jgi:hypothetical protein
MPGLTRHLPLALILAALFARPIGAQELRTVTLSKQYRGQDSLDAEIEFAAGVLKVRPGVPGSLYRMELSYDPERFAPLSQSDSNGSHIRLGVKSSGQAGISVGLRNERPQDGTIELNPSAVLALDLTLGAVQADVDLGGLKVAEATIQTGASQTTLRFSSPNRVRCDRLAVSVGAAQFSALQLGNSDCDEIHVEGGVGGVLVDLTGAWKRNANVSLSVALGDISLVLPKEVGVELTLDRFLSNFNPEGFVREGRSYRSRNYTSAERKLTLSLTSTVGAVKVEWR